jgi:magnesium-transporting ATPase (P-type)
MITATVMLLQNQEVPADAIMLYSSHLKGICFVETASLDGETNLKVKASPGLLQRTIRERATLKDGSSVTASDIARVLSKLRGRVCCEAPNAHFDQFKGRLTMDDADGCFSELAARDDTSLDSSHLLLRGTVVKNTEFVFALVAYTGVESKIRKNCERVGAEPTSQSRLMLIMNRLISLQFLAQLVRWSLLTDSTASFLKFSSFFSVHLISACPYFSHSRHSARLLPSCRAQRHPA